METPNNTPLSEPEIDRALEQLDGWHFAENSIGKTFQFGDFREAIGFIVRISFEAEAMNHHPELSNVYSQVHIALSTHDAGNRVTAKDLELARRINDISWI